MLPPRQSTLARLRSRHLTRAYTAVEVLMAMAFAAIGSASIVAMMKTSVQGDEDARKTDVANAIAHMWTERLRRDAMQWTLPNSSGTGNNLANAKLLNYATAYQWRLPGDYLGTTNPETMSYAFDILGRDLASADIGNATFCVHVRESWLVAPNPPSEPGLMRADVRVIWFRGLIQSATPPSSAICDTSYVSDTPDKSPPILHAIYLTTSIKENGQQ